VRLTYQALFLSDLVRERNRAIVPDGSDRVLLRSNVVVRRVLDDLGCGFSAFLPEFYPLADGFLVAPVLLIQGSVPASACGMIKILPGERFYRRKFPNRAPLR
jgi:hypothetical protein